MLSLSALLPIIGYTGIAGIVFAESGMLVGFFLPGDSLLFTAGFLASQGIFSIVPLCALIFGAAVAGNSTGYFFGHRIGRNIFQKEESLFFHRDNLIKAEAFYEKHGGKTLILAQFMPIVRTFVPILAGVGAMHYRKFIMYNVIGAAFWGIGLPALGYFLGNAIPGVDKYLIPIILVIIILSLMPTLIHVLRTPKDRKKFTNAIRKGVRQVKQKISGSR